MKPCEEGIRCPHKMTMELLGDLCLMARSSGGFPRTVDDMLDDDCYIIDKPEEIKQIEEEFGEDDNDDYKDE